VSISLRQIKSPVKKFIQLHYFSKCKGFTHNGKRTSFLDPEKSNSLVKQRILESRPLMVARHGSTELHYVIKNRGFDQLCSNAGFFPSNEGLGESFKEIYTSACKHIDALAVWNYRRGGFLEEKKIFSEHSPNSQLVDRSFLTPFLFQDPWSQALAGKSVLVVHPFSEAIASQYAKREYLFSNPNVLPEFKELKLIKAVQSIAGSECPFEDWFAALEHMKNQISNSDFEVALIGCGAYGLPLAAHVKSLGKQAIHVGGALQLLFGIKGGRWDKGDENVNLFYNEHWVRPGENDRPKNYKSIENGCYW
jgi:hypothetical protein